MIKPQKRPVVNVFEKTIRNILKPNPDSGFYSSVFLYIA